MTTTRLKLRGPADRDSVRHIDMTPTWAAIMPALIAALENGTGEGRTMARGELERLAREVDALNARAKEESAPFHDGLEIADRADLAADLARMAGDNMRTADSPVYNRAMRALYLGRASAFSWAAAHVAGDLSDSARRQIATERLEEAADLARKTADTQ